MRKPTFDVLCLLLAPYMEPDCNPVRQPLELSKRVAVAVYKLASCCKNRVVADVFGIHKSTVVKYVKMFCITVVNHLLNDIIKFPDKNDAKQIAQKFERKTHFLQVMGAIDGTHIPIMAPTDGYHDFINRKLWASFVLQAVVDDRGR